MFLFDESSLDTVVGTEILGVVLTCKLSGELVGVGVDEVAGVCPELVIEGLVVVVGVAGVCLELAIEGLTVVAVVISGEKGTYLRKNCQFLFLMEPAPSMLTK